MKRISFAERNVSTNATSVYSNDKETGEYRFEIWSSQIRFIQQKRENHLAKFLWVIRTLSCCIHVFPFRNG